jgi:hypothetical protein
MSKIIDNTPLNGAGFSVGYLYETGKDLCMKKEEKEDSTT